MKPRHPATLQELKSIRKILLRQIKEAQLLFNTQSNGHELLTSRAALQCIEELIKNPKTDEAA